MAQYGGTFACGHEGLVNVYGKHSEREQKIEKAFSRVCPKCYEKEKTERIERENRESLSKSEDYGFPKLSGTEKQISWANTIRLKFYEEFWDSETMHEMIENEKKASFWIDTIHCGNKERFLEEYEDQIEKIDKFERIISMDAVAPEELKHEGVVEIVKIMERICLYFQKDDDFIQLVKSKKYRWHESDSCWCRTLSDKTGTYADRAAEIGHALLKNGFAICIHDAEITENAIAGKYEKECYKWVTWNGVKKSLALSWTVRDKSYEASRKIKNNTYNNRTDCVEIPICHYRAVNNFAKKYDFQYSEEALEKIEQYKEEVRNMRRAKMKENQPK